MSRWRRKPYMTFSTPARFLEPVSRPKVLIHQQNVTRTKNTTTKITKPCRILAESRCRIATCPRRVVWTGPRTTTAVWRLHQMPGHSRARRGRKRHRPETSEDIVEQRSTGHNNQRYRGVTRELNSSKAGFHDRRVGNTKPAIPSSR